LTRTTEPVRTRLNAFTSRYPWLILLAAAGLALLGGSRLLDFSSGELKIEIDSSLVGLLPTSGKALATHEQVRDRFGGDDILLVAWFSDALFTADKLRQLKRLTRRIERLDGVRRVDSLASALRVSEEDGAVRIDRFLHRIPTEPDALDALRADAVANPIYRGRLVSPDGRGVLLAVHFDTALGSQDLAELVVQIGDTSRAESGDIEQFISGPVHARLEISRILFRDVRSTLPLAILATALVAALTLRSIRRVETGSERGLPELASGSKRSSRVRYRYKYSSAATCRMRSRTPCICAPSKTSNVGSKPSRSSALRRVWSILSACCIERLNPMRRRVSRSRLHGTGWTTYCFSPMAMTSGASPIRGMKARCCTYARPPYRPTTWAD